MQLRFDLPLASIAKEMEPIPQSLPTSPSNGNQNPGVVLPLPNRVFKDRETCFEFVFSIAGDAENTQSVSLVR
jgi:hypothetical protein